MPKISILLVDDHAIIREGLKALLSAETDMQIVGEAEDGQQALQMLKDISPDVVIMDVAMPRMGGLAATRQLLKIAPTAKILVVSSYHDDECVMQFVRAGVAGYVLKQTGAADLASAVRQVRRGQRFFSQPLGQRLENLARRTASPRATQLTTREMQVLTLIVSGSANQQAADALGISIKTIEKHRQSVMNKLNLHEVSGLTRYAISTGILQVPLPTPFSN